ncbi:MAG TPA: hypothetical protein VN372_05765 [Methanospirillum sp.]|nr:hypothetical protein [Methanospirillum sp.]
MSDLANWIAGNKKLCQPGKEHVVRAVRHLSRVERKNLFSDEISFMKSAEGRWFEMISYELFLDLASKTDTIRSVVLKGDDVRGKKELPALGQDGFFYSRNGDITIRGNGQDLAEFDQLLMKKDGSLVFVEVVTSPADLRDFMQEIYYKKQLIRYLFNQKAVTFILVTSFPLTNYKGGRKVLGSEEHISICTEACESFRSFITGSWNKLQMTPILPPKKTIRATNLHLCNPFTYKIFHDLEREWVFTHLTEGDTIPNLPSPHRSATLVKKIIFGRLYPSTNKRLTEKYRFTYKDKELSYEDIQLQFSKVILAADLPDYTPLIYFRLRQKKEYYKMVFDGEGTFRYERKTPPKVGFFVWLESLEPELGSGISIKVIDTISKYCFSTGQNNPPQS